MISLTFDNKYIKKLKETAMRGLIHFFRELVGEITELLMEIFGERMRLLLSELLKTSFIAILLIASLQILEIPFFNQIDVLGRTLNLIDRLGDWAGWLALFTALYFISKQTK